MRVPFSVPSASTAATLVEIVRCGFYPGIALN